MRIPLKINSNCQETYKPSERTLNLLNEIGRKIKSEDLEWDKDDLPSLVTLCIWAINKTFTKRPIFNELPLQDREHLLELIDLDCPLELAISLLDDELYWKRRYMYKYGIIITPKPHDWTWKSIFLEKFIEDKLEQAEPQYRDEYELIPLMKMCHTYINRIILTKLKIWSPPLSVLPEEIPEFLPKDHIEFSPICETLTEIEELSIIFGENNLQYDFEQRKFEISVDDCTRLGKAVNLLMYLTILRVHKSRLEDDHIRALVTGLIENYTIIELDLSNCAFGDVGALCVAKLIQVHPKLTILNISNNKIRASGAEGIGYALLQDNSAPIQNLDISLNPLYEAGVMGIFRALVRDEQQIADLSIAACFLDGEGPTRLAQMIALNTSLRSLNVSNNHIGEEAGELLVNYLENKRNFDYIDVRNTGITPQQANRIARLCTRNRRDLHDVEPSLEEEFEEQSKEELIEEFVEEEEEALEENSIDVDFADPLTENYRGSLVLED